MRGLTSRNSPDAASHSNPPGPINSSARARATRLPIASANGRPVPELSSTDAELDRLAELLAERVAARVGTGSPWLSAHGAAAYLICPESRIRKLTMTGELPCHRDGRRVLYRREELDAYVRRGGALSP